MHPIDQLITGFTKENGIFSTLNMSGSPYDAKAKTYEKLVDSMLYNKLMWGTQPSDYKSFSEKAIFESKGIGLDIGCGGLVQTAKQYACVKSEFILLDNSIEMLKIGKFRIEKITDKVTLNLHFIQSDAFNLPFAENSFDTVCSFGVLHIFNEKKQFLNEAVRVLKPGGKLCFTSLTNERRFSRFYISFLKSQGEFGQAINARQTLDLINEDLEKINWYQTGSMIFVSGIKKKSLDPVVSV